MNTILDILKMNKCCGCGACINVCPQKALTYSNDKYGFTIPAINLNLCIDCGKCLRICPETESEEYKPQLAYAAMNKNKKERLKASSGGVFGLVAKYVIQSSGVVYGAKMDHDFKVLHSSADNDVALNDLLRSKYVQSFMGETYSHILNDLKSGKKVLFSGTPCQVAAVRKMIPLKFKDNLFLIDIVCHGVPSQRFFDSYLEYISDKEGKVNFYQFRAKRTVNNGMNCFFSYGTETGHKRIKNWPEDTFNYLYMKSYIYRDSCYQCKFAKENRPGDITLCDYWSWTEYHNEFPAGSTVSAILINTDKGNTLFEAVKDDLYVVETKIDDIKRHNGCLVQPSEKPQIRDQLLDNWLKNGFEPLDINYKSKSKKSILKYKIMRIIPASIMSQLVSVRKRFGRRR